jgi:hypothetical protein
LKKNKIFENLKYEEIYKDSIMLIDEIDLILDPTKSNFNIQLEITNKIDENIYDKIKKFILNQYYKNDEVFDKDDTDDKNKLIKLELNQIDNQIKNNIYKYNINWGIHPFKGYAIPFLNKDKPDLSSSFSSIILTIYLTLYFYIIKENFKMNDTIKNYIINNNIISNIFKKDILKPSDDELYDIYRNDENKLLIYESIINTINLTKSQLNISFIDILLIKNIYKIGYSGTLNINYPSININYSINNDYDEIVNIKYIIVNENTKILKNNILEKITNDLKYDAYIDVCGYYRNVKNEELSKQFYHILNLNELIIEELLQLIYLYPS